MINYKEPAVELVPNPVGLDIAIQAIQARLAAGLPWLQKAFGRVTIQTETNPSRDGKKQQEKIIPEAYYKREPFSLMVNDNLQSYCFFVAGDSMEFIKYDPMERFGALVNQPLAIIFWVNLEKIDATKKYNFMEELRRDCVEQLKRCPAFLLESSSIEYNQVFNPFTITETFKQFLKPPFAAWRFDGTLAFDYLKC
jgi:hypothetical protein